MAVAERKAPAARSWASQLSRRLGWGVTDQAMCSLTNFLLSIYIARTLGAAQFGAFSLAYVTYGFAINASRGLSIEPLLVRFSGTNLQAWRRATAGSTGTALLVGFGTGTCALVAAPLVGGTTGKAFLALGLMLPALLLQDSWRYAFFAHGQGHHAFINDAIWAVVQIPLLLYLKLSGHANVFTCVLAWGAGAVAGAAFGALQARVLPSLANAKDWLVHHRDLGPRFLLENTGGNAADTLRSYGISYILGIVAVGYIQAAAVLMGPFKIIFYGLGMITIPEAARLLRRSPRRLPLFCGAASAALTLVAMVWGVALLVLMPLGLGHLMLGSLWRPAYPLVLPTVLAMMGTCASTGAGIGMHALGAARRSLRATLISSALFVTFALLGAEVGGTLGAMRFYAAVSWFGTLVFWWQFRQALREYGDTVRVPNWMWPGSAGRHHRSSTAASPHYRRTRDAASRRQPTPSLDGISTNGASTNSTRLH